MSSNEAIEQLLHELGAHHAQSPERVRILRSVVTRFVELAEFDMDDGDLRVAATVMNELLEAANVFSPWRDHPKLTVFGSARTKPDSPLYAMASELSKRMAERGWITVSGAGPGIMEAAAMGAGRDRTLGVNIELPFEQSSNAYVDAETRLVEMKYFFTRKVALTKESLAFAIFPGGLGTMDETFEVLTLLHTGKSRPAPVVLIDVPKGTYWEKWQHFVDDAIIDAGYVAGADMCLFRICHSLESAIAEIERFFTNYASFDLADGRGHLSVRQGPTPDELDELANTLPVFSDGRGFEFDGESTLSFAFDGRNYVSLRLLIDIVNGWVA